MPRWCANLLYHLASVLLVLLLPLLILLALVISPFLKRRLLKAVRDFPCVNCHAALGPESLPLAEELCRKVRADHTKHTGRPKLVEIPVAHAVCPSCQAEYRYLFRKRSLVPRSTVAMLCVSFVAAFPSCRKQDEPASSQPAEKQSPRMAPAKNILHIDHDGYEGTEMFRVTHARCNLRKTEDGVWEFTVGIESASAVQRHPDLVEMMPAPEPNFEATALLPPDDLALKPGRIITQKEGYDRSRGNLSNYYYSSHWNVEDLKVELLQVTGEWIEARVTGITDNKTKLAVETRFKRDPAFKRGIQ